MELFVIISLFNWFGVKWMFVSYFCIITVQIILFSLSVDLNIERGSDFNQMEWIDTNM